MLCSLRNETSALASLGISNVVLSDAGVTRKSDISALPAASPMFYHLKNAFTCPGLVFFRSSGHGSLSLVEALVKTGYASFLLTINQSNELIRSLTFSMLALLLACPNGPQ